MHSTPPTWPTVSREHHASVPFVTINTLIVGYFHSRPSTIGISNTPDIHCTTTLSDSSTTQILKPRLMRYTTFLLHLQLQFYYIYNYFYHCWILILTTFAICTPTYQLCPQDGWNMIKIILHFYLYFIAKKSKSLDFTGLKW